MPPHRGQEPTWQPISALAMVASLIDAQVEGAREQYQTLLRAEARPYVLATPPWLG